MAPPLSTPSRRPPGCSASSLGASQCLRFNRPNPTSGAPPTPAISWSPQRHTQSSPTPSPAQEPSCGRHLQKLTLLTDWPATMSRHLLLLWDYGTVPEISSLSHPQPSSPFRTINTLVRAAPAVAPLSLREKAKSAQWPRGPTRLSVSQPPTPNSRTFLGPRTFRHRPSTLHACPQGPRGLVLSFLQSFLSLALSRLLPIH